MKKYLLIGIALLSLSLCHEAKANGTTYYAKVTVDVAEDSKGLGTVYILEDEQHLSEATGEKQDPGDQSGGASVNFMIMNEPAEGYVLSNFTDQNGEVYTYPDAATGSNPYDISVFSTSSNPDEPAVFNLLAHFVKAGEVSQDELIEVTLTPEIKFTTFISPSQTEIPDDIKVYTVTGINSNAVVLDQLDEEQIPAFTPVLIENTGIFDVTLSSTYNKGELPEELPSLTTGLLTGTLENISAPEGSFILELDPTGGSKFVKVGNEDTQVNAYNCFMTVENSDADAFLIKSPQTGVSSLTDDNNKPEIYSIDGQRRQSLEKGVNIVNGIKIIVR